MIRKAALSALTIGLCMAAKAPSPAFDIPADRIVNATVEGQPARMLAMANGVDYPVLNPSIAAKLGLKGGFIVAHINVGPVKLKGDTGVVKLGVAGPPAKRRALWFDRAIAPGADGALGPGAMPQPVITFHLRAPANGERAFVLPLVGRDDQMGTALSIGGESLFVQFDLGRGPTLATAAAGQILAQAQNGQLEGPAGRIAIRFGVERPVRALILANPLPIGPVAIRRIMVRISDNGSTSGIADADAVDTGEIVVSAKGKAKPSYRMAIGTSDLAGCSSVSFDKPGKRIILSCIAPSSWK